MLSRLSQLVQPQRRSLVAWLAAAALCCSLAVQAQQTPATQTPTQPVPTPPAAPPAANAAALQKEAEQALTFILQREVLDPRALAAVTNSAQPAQGNWSIGKIRPASCPPTSENCLRIIYRIPGTPISCEWVVLLKPDGLNGTILEQNPDSIRYMLRNVPTAEAAPLVLSRAIPPVSRMAGTVEVQLIVTPTGEPGVMQVVSGPDALRPISLATAKQWIFKPLLVANRAIPFQTTIKFIYGSKVKTEP